MKVLFWMFIGFDQHTTSEHLLAAVVEQLCKAGHSVHIIQKDLGGNLPAIPETLREYSVTTDRIPFHTVDKTNFVARYLAELKYINESKKYITSEYDAVFIQSNNEAGFSLRAVRKKLPNAIVTLNVQDVFPNNAVFSGKIKKNSALFKLLASIQRYGYKHSDHIITISDDMRKTLEEAGVDDNKIKVIYNWSYQDGLYKDMDNRPTINRMFKKDFCNVVYAGNIGIMQNVDLIIETARLMKKDEKIWFHIIGEGVRKVMLEEKAHDYEIKNIDFWPMLPPEEAPYIYALADINIIPLVKDVYKTALPSKTATCLACQTPIIFAIGKESEFGRRLAKETGCPIIEPDDPMELANIIRTIANGEQFCNTGQFFLKNCKRTENSREYARIICSISE